MARYLFLLSAVMVFAGCSSDDKTPKFEAAEGSSPTENVNQPAWIAPNQNESTASSNVGGGNNIAAGGSNGASTSSTGLGPTGNGGVGTVVSPQSGGSSSSILSPGLTGQASVLMSKLESITEQATSLYNESSSKQFTKEEFDKLVEQYDSLLKDRIGIADQLLKLKLRETDREKTVRLKLNALQQLAEKNHEDYESKMFEFAATLKDDPNFALRKRYELFHVQEPMTNLLRGEEVDLEDFYARFSKLTSFYRDDIEVFEIANQWISRAYSAKKRAQFMKLLETAVSNFQSSTDKKVVANVKRLSDRLMMGRLDFDIAVVDVQQRKEGAPEKLIEAAKRVLAGKDISEFVLLQVARSGIQLEAVQEYDLSKQYFQLVADRLEGFSDQQFKSNMERLIGNAKTRHNLIGKPLKIEGMVPKFEARKFTRKQLDFSAYQGKVVVVFFWANGDPASRGLMEQLDKLYLANQDKGMDLIGINADANPSHIQAVISIEAPMRKWAILLPNTPTTIGLESAMARRCGVDFMPFSILIDQKGIVRHIRIYSEQLEDEIEKLLGKKISRVSTAAKKSSEAKAKETTPSGDTKPNKDQPKKDQPKKDQPKKDQPKKNQPKKNQPKTDSAKSGEPETKKPETDNPKSQPKANSESPKPKSTQPEASKPAKNAADPKPELQPKPNESKNDSANKKSVDGPNPDKVDQPKDKPEPAKKRTRRKTKLSIKLKRRLVQRNPKARKKRTVKKRTVKKRTEQIR